MVAGTQFEVQLIETKGTPSGSFFLGFLEGVSESCRKSAGGDAWPEGGYDGRGMGGGMKNEQRHLSNNRSFDGGSASYAT